jgi:hypothetical protein
MTLTVNTNSYVTVVTADTYLETRIDSDNWTAASTALKESALVTATALVDDHAWIGSAVSSSQALAWPRNNATYNDTRMGATITIGNTVIPDQVIEAVYEQALHLVDNEDLLQGKTQTFESISVGSVSVSDSNNDTNRIPIKPSLVLKKIRPLLNKAYSTSIGASWWRAN